MPYRAFTCTCLYRLSMFLTGKTFLQINASYNCSSLFGSYCITRTYSFVLIRWSKIFFQLQGYFSASPYIQKKTTLQKITSTTNYNLHGVCSENSEIFDNELHNLNEVHVGVHCKLHFTFTRLWENHMSKGTMKMFIHTNTKD